MLDRYRLLFHTSYVVPTPPPFKCHAADFWLAEPLNRLLKRTPPIAVNPPKRSSCPKAPDRADGEALRIELDFELASRCGVDRTCICPDGAKSSSQEGNTPRWRRDLEFGPVLLARAPKRENGAVRENGDLDVVV